MNSAKFAVASGPTGVAASTHDGIVAPHRRRNAELRTIRYTVVYQGLRLATALLPEKSSPLVLAGG